MALKQKIAWIDCSNGIAGNMVLGALIDLGFAPARLNELVRILKLGKVQIRVRKDARNGLSGILVRIDAEREPRARHLKEIQEMIQSAPLPELVKSQSVKAFQILAEAEAKVHSVSLEEIHFHELGAVDTILDIVGSILGFYELGISRIYFSQLRLGGGQVNCAHGVLPVPAPATLELLKGLPVRGGEDEEGELTTPTGAVLARILAQNFGPMPEMKVEKIGYGLGERKLKTRPNLLRIVLGSAFSGAEELIQLEASIDDMNPEYYEPMMRELFGAGALEVSLIPAQMKKNRPGVLLRALCPQSHLEQIILAMFTHSTTTGLRFYPVNRVSLFREVVWIKTRYGKVRLKQIELPDGKKRIHPEFEDLRRISEKRQIPILALENEVLTDWLRNGKKPGK